MDPDPAGGAVGGWHRGGLPGGGPAEPPPPPGIQAIRAERAYLNAYFETSTYATRVVDAVLREGAEFGKGRPRDERVMVEYAQPNTLHSFPIGHARNVVWGESLARLVQFA